MSSFVYSDPRWMHLPGDRARCGCHIERETGALSMCEACELAAEATARQRWDAEVDALADHFERRWAS